MGFNFHKLVHVTLHEEQHNLVYHKPQYYYISNYMLRSGLTHQALLKESKFHFQRPHEAFKGIK